MSSVELARRLGTREPTAWLMKRKLMAAMEEREVGKPKLAGRVEVDDAIDGRAVDPVPQGMASPGRGHRLGGLLNKVCAVGAACRSMAENDDAAGQSGQLARTVSDFRLAVSAGTFAVIGPIVSVLTRA